MASALPRFDDWPEARLRRPMTAGAVPVPTSLGPGDVAQLITESRMQAYALPLVHAPWMSQALPGLIPRETRATCTDCAMCSQAARPDSPYVYFDPQVKCCSYLPCLANFLVGGILANADPEAEVGRASVVERIGRRDGVRPIGLLMTAGYARVYDQMTSGFGRSAALRCPHFVVTETGGHCGIWAHRPSVCTTYFCKHDRGAVGERFWHSLRDWLWALEAELSTWCALELGAPPEAVPPTSPPEPGSSSGESLEAADDESAYASAWGRWNRRELEFYEQCAELVKQLDSAAVSRIASPQVHELSEVVRQNYGELISEAVPARLAVGKFSMDGTEEDGYRATAYSIFDPLRLSGRLARAIPLFTGQPWEVATKDIQAELGFTIDRSLLRRMVDFGILVGSDEDQDGRDESRFKELERSHQVAGVPEAPAPSLPAA